MCWQILIITAAAALSDSFFLFYFVSLVHLTSQKPDPRADSKFYGELRNVADDLAKRPTGRFGAFGSNEERFRPHTTGGSGTGTTGLRYAFISIRRKQAIFSTNTVLRNMSERQQKQNKNLGSNTNEALSL